MRAGPATAMRTGRPGPGPDHGGSGTFPRLVSIVVSHTSRPSARSAVRTASLFSTTGHQPGARPRGPALARWRPACRKAVVCLVTTASSADRSAAVRGSAVTVAIRVWLPATPRRPGSRTSMGTVILIVPGGRRWAAFHRLMVAIRAVTRTSFTVAPGSLGTAGTSSSRSPQPSRAPGRSGRSRSGAMRATRWRRTREPALAAWRRCWPRSLIGISPLAGGVLATRCGGP